MYILFYFLLFDFYFIYFLFYFYLYLFYFLLLYILDYNYYFLDVYNNAILKSNNSFCISICNIFNSFDGFIILITFSSEYIKKYIYIERRDKYWSNDFTKLLIIISDVKIWISNTIIICQTKCYLVLFFVMDKCGCIIQNLSSYIPRILKKTSYIPFLPYYIYKYIIYTKYIML